MSRSWIELEKQNGVRIIRVCSEDGTNLLTTELILSLTSAMQKSALSDLPAVITGNQQFFSAGADLCEIARLDGPSAREFSKMGQELMLIIEHFPAPVYAAISGYCMGGGLDLALACGYRIASPHTIFGHRGAALGLITGWGGTQRLPRLIGKARALEMFVGAQKVPAAQALQIGLVDAIADDPIGEAVHRIRLQTTQAADPMN